MYWIGHRIVRHHTFCNSDPEWGRKHDWQWPVVGIEGRSAVVYRWSLCASNLWAKSDVHPIIYVVGKRHCVVCVYFVYVDDDVIWNQRVVRYGFVAFVSERQYCSEKIESCPRRRVSCEWFVCFARWLYTETKVKRYIITSHERWQREMGTTQRGYMIQIHCIWNLRSVTT